MIIGGFTLGVGAIVTKLLENTLTAHPSPYKLVSISSIKYELQQLADNLYSGLEVSIRLQGFIGPFRIYLARCDLASGRGHRHAYRWHVITADDNLTKRLCLTTFQMAGLLPAHFRIT